MVANRDVEELDEGEGGYHRVEMPICMMTNEATIDAWVYLANKPNKDSTYGIGGFL